MLTLAQVQDQITTHWSPIFTQRLKEVLLLGGLVNKDYEGEIRQGNTVRVSQVNALTAELRTVGVDASTFGTSSFSTSKVDLVVDKRAVCGLEVEDLVELQSQIAKQQVQDEMIFAVAKQINDYLYSLCSPSTSNPDHVIGSTSSLALDELALARRLASEALWPDDGQRYGLISPQYWETILKNTTLSSGDYVEDSPVINGQKARRLLGWNLYEDNSRTGKLATFLHPNFMLFAQQQALNMKVSDLHGNKQFGYVMSVDTIFGAKLGINGNVKHIQFTS